MIVHQRFKRLGGYILHHSLLAQVAEVWVATALANVLFYLFHLLVGRGLGPEDYSLFEALFGVVVIFGALASGTQLSVARIVAEARASNRGAEIDSLITTVFVQVALLGVVVLVLVSIASPWLGSYVHSQSVVPVLITGIIIFLSILMSAILGALQGMEKFLPLSGTVLTDALSRLLLGLLALDLGLGVSGALSAVGLAALVATGVGLALIRPPLTFSFGRLSWKTLLMVLVPTSLGTLAMRFPSNVDVLLVRHLFPSPEAGLYAGVAILGRVVLFVPLAVSVVLFPKVLQQQSLVSPPWRILYQSLGLAALLSGSVALGFLLFPGLALSFALGSEYTGGRYLVPYYAVAMFTFNLSVVFAHYYLAVERNSYLYLLLLPHMVMMVILLYVFHGSLIQVALVLLSINASLLVFSLLFTGMAKCPGPLRLYLIRKSSTAAAGGNSVVRDG